MIKGLRIFTFLKANPNGQKPDLRCRFIQNLETLEGLITYLQIKTGSYDSKREIGDCLMDNNGKYHIANSAYDARVKTLDMKKFEKIVDQMLASDFVNKMEFGSHYKKGKYSISILPTGIHTYDIGDKFFIDVNYVSKDDHITVKSNCSINETLVGYALDSRIPVELLSDYHRKAIDNSLSTSKPMDVFVDSDNSVKADLSIIESDNMVILEGYHIKRK